MSERIKELEKQAHEDVIRNTPSFLVTNEIYEQKFAELLIKECVKVTLESIYNNGIGDVNDCIIVGNDVAKHFGFEE
jgi:hypothetical protein